MHKTLSGIPQSGGFTVYPSKTLFLPDIYVFVQHDIILPLSLHKHINKSLELTWIPPLFPAGQSNSDNLFLSIGFGN